MFGSSFDSVRRLICLACGATMMLATATASAAVVNKYTFNNGNIVDSVGGANGTLVDNTGIAKFTGGMLDLSGNNNVGSNQDFSNPATVGAFVDLPNMLLNNAISGGTFGQASLEIWFTVQENRDWAEVYSFGDSNGPEGVSDGGDGQNYIALIPRSGSGNNDFRATTRSATGSPNETPIIGTTTPAPLNQKQHAVLTFDISDPSAGANGTAKLYLNNSPAVSAEIRPLLDLVSDNNNWLGRSPWPDSLFDGFIDEFRIYDNALTATEVANSVPEPAPLPVLVIDRATGAISVANQSGTAIQLKGYSISSSAGSFNPLTWVSIDNGNAFDPDGGWTAQSSTAFNLAESNTAGPSLNGGTLAAPPGAGSTRGIGTPWLKTPIEDVTFSFTLGDGTTGNGLVQYTGTAISRSDLDGNGSINPADWSAFITNSYKSFTGESKVAAYRKGDLDGDLDNDYFDYKLFKSDYIAVNGLQAFLALGVVPEPNTLALLTFAASMILGVRRK